MRGDKVTPHYSFLALHHLRRTIVEVLRRVDSVRGVGQFVSWFEHETLRGECERHAPAQDGHNEANGVGMLAPGPASRTGTYQRRGVAARCPGLFQVLKIDRHRELVLDEFRPFLTFRVFSVGVRPGGEKTEADSSKKGAAVHYSIT